jgi:sugar lactone lactonase YvrE
MNLKTLWILLAGFFFPFQAMAHSFTSDACRPTITTVPGFSPVAPTGLVFDKSGNLFVTAGAEKNGLIWMVNLDGKAPSESATIYQKVNAEGIVLNGRSDLFIFRRPTSSHDFEILKIDSNTGKMEPIIRTALETPSSSAGALAIDSQGNLYFGDGGNVKKIVAINGGVTPKSIVNTLVDSGGGFGLVDGLAFDAKDNLFISYSNGIIRQLAAADGNLMFNNPMRTIAGTGIPGFSGDGGKALKAQLGGGARFRGMLIDKTGDLYFADPANSRIRVIHALGGVITSESWVTTYLKTDETPAGLAFDRNGNIYFAETAANQVQKILACPPCPADSCTMGIRDPKRGICGAISINADCVNDQIPSWPTPKWKKHKNNN